MKKGDLITVNVERYAFEGRGIARIDGELNPESNTALTELSKNFEI